MVHFEVSGDTLHFRWPVEGGCALASLANTYIGDSLQIKKEQACLIFGLGIGQGYGYWLNRALRTNRSNNLISLDDFLAQQYSQLSSKERQCLGILILAFPGYNSKRDLKTRSLLKSDIREIRRAVNGFKPDQINEYCRWSRIDKRQFFGNIADLEQNLH